MKRDNLIISPTGGKIRFDSKGAGDYGAPRGGNIHKGVDFICVPGQEVRCPINKALVVRLAYPYEDLSYNGLLIRNDFMEVMMFYVRPREGIIGERVEQNEVIGVAEDISERYSSKMTPHVHLEVCSVDPELLMKGD